MQRRPQGGGSNWRAAGGAHRLLARGGARPLALRCGAALRCRGADAGSNACLAWHDQPQLAGSQLESPCMGSAAAPAPPASKLLLPSNPHHLTNRLQAFTTVLSPMPGPVGRTHRVLVFAGFAALLLASDVFCEVITESTVSVRGWWGRPRSGGLDPRLCGPPGTRAHPQGPSQDGTCRRSARDPPLPRPTASGHTPRRRRRPPPAAAGRAA